MEKGFFIPKFFTPYSCKIFARFVNSSGNIPFRMYTDGTNIEYELNGFRLFIPRSILNQNYRFGRIQGAQKRLILHFNLTEEDIGRLIEALGGTYKRISTHTPKLGDLLK